MSAESSRHFVSFPLRRMDEANASSRARVAISDFSSSIVLGPGQGSALPRLGLHFPVLLQDPRHRRRRVTAWIRRVLLQPLLAGELPACANVFQAVHAGAGEIDKSLQERKPIAVAGSSMRQSMPAPRNRKHVFINTAHRALERHHW